MLQVLLWRSNHKTSDCSMSPDKPVLTSDECFCRTKSKWLNFHGNLPSWVRPTVAWANQASLWLWETGGRSAVAGLFWDQELVIHYREVTCRAWGLSPYRSLQWLACSARDWVQDGSCQHGAFMDRCWNQNLQPYTLVLLPNGSQKVF